MNCPNLVPLFFTRDMGGASQCTASGGCAFCVVVAIMAPMASYTHESMSKPGKGAAVLNAPSLICSTSAKQMTKVLVELRLVFDVMLRVELLVLEAQRHEVNN